MKKLIILSGGMDSMTALEINRGHKLEAITFDYGSKHNSKEYQCAKKYCDKLGIKLIKFDLPLDKYFKSDLLKSGDNIPDGHYEDDSMKKTVVPFRNGIMLAIAIGYAESINANSVVIGNHAGDHAIYPDCRGTFINAMNEAAAYGTYNNIKIESPFCGKSKREIALIGKELNIDYTKTWSCYKGEDLHCGTCGTCVERKEALKGFDETRYK